jgi:hypothetical protein
MHPSKVKVLYRVPLHLYISTPVVKQSPVILYTRYQK